MMMMMTVMMMTMMLVQVRENSKEALGWLKDKPRNTKCVTSKGGTPDIMLPISTLENLLTFFLKQSVRCPSFHFVNILRNPAVQLWSAL